LKRELREALVGAGSTPAGAVTSAEEVG
jgi:hypothetical protein